MNLLSEIIGVWTCQKYVNSKVSLQAKQGQAKDDASKFSAIFHWLYGFNTSGRDLRVYSGDDDDS